MAEDDHHIITINCNTGTDTKTGTDTAKDETDLFYFDKITRLLVKRVEMIEVIKEATKANSQCRYLTYDNSDGKIYVVDMGLDTIYSLYSEGGEDVAGCFGDPGAKVGQFTKPAGVAVDGLGALIVVDSGNNRLQIVDSQWNCVGTVKVQVFNFKSITYFS